MKSRVIGYSLLMFVVMIGITATETFADNSRVNISIAEESSLPGCEENNECYTPYNVTVDLGGEVIWNNTDTAAHTVTSGTPNDGPSGLFDSSLFVANSTFSVTFTEDSFSEGDYPYFCMVHPWMEGIISVESVSSEEYVATDIEDDNIILQSISSDGSIKIEIESSKPEINKEMTVNVKFYDYASGNLQEHINYDITASQNDDMVLSVVGAHEHNGNANHSTMELSSDDPVDITVTIQGIGVDDIVGPQGDTIEFTIVPEFGTIAVAVLTISMIGATALATKYKAIKL